MVPDVALSFVALRWRRLALVACIWAFAGALAGGCVMYVWGARDAESARAALAAIPAIDQLMITRVRGELEEIGAAAVALGPLKTTPYKIYAVEGGALGVPIVGMLAASVASRLGRFLLVTLAVGWVASGPLRGWTLNHKRWLLMAIWIVVYAVLLAAR